MANDGSAPVGDEMEGEDMVQKKNEKSPCNEEQKREKARENE